MLDHSNNNQPPVQRDTVLFDFDGTLATVTIDFDHMRQAAFAAARKVHPSIAPPNGQPILEWLDAAVLALGTEEHELATVLRQQVMNQLREIEVHAAARGKLLPFTRGLLSALRKAGVAVGIITRNCTDAVTAVFPDIHEHADVILTRDDVRQVKPHPEHIATALARLGSHPAKTVMVGDHPLDMQAGRTSGTMAAGVLTGTSNAASLMQGGAHIVEPDAMLLVKRLTHEYSLGGRNGQHTGNSL